MYSEHSKIISGLLPKAQEAERDQREMVRESEYFVDKRDGQWEPDIWQSRNGKPRYTFDKTNPIVNQISGEITRASFDSKVRPAGGDATKELAELYDGIVRNIESVSGAQHIYNAAAKRMIVSGLNGWMVKQAYIDGDSFDQDLMIEGLSDFVDRVWFDPQSIMQDKSDAEYCFLLTQMGVDEYKKAYPDGSGMSVGEDRDFDVYYYKAESIVVGQIFYKKKVMRELVRMTNGAVYVVDDKYEAIRDDLAKYGITEDSRRNRACNKVWSRKFDAGDWLEDEEETVFSWLPIIPNIGNFKITEGKCVYRGVVEKLMDQQRVYNYARSRQIEEGALAPRAKYWMTEEMAAGHEDELETMNTNSDAVQYFNPDPNMQGYVPQQNGGATVNAGLETAAAAAGIDLQESSGLMPAGYEGQGNQSGFAIEQLIDKSSVGTSWAFEAQEIAISHTTRILVDAIPKVYTNGRVMRILNEDGSFDMQKLNDEVIDQQTGQMVAINDLTKGTYDTICSAGKSYANRQQETLAAIEKLAAYDPSVIAEAGDIIYNNVEAPGMDMIAERKRAALMNAGAIPFDQMTDEEKQQAQQAAQQPQQPDAMMVAAQAEMQKAQAENDKNQLTMQKQQMEFQGQQMDFKIKQQKQSLETERARFELQKERAKYGLASQEQGRKDQMTRADIANKDADTLNKRLEAAERTGDLSAISNDELMRIAAGAN